VEINRDSTMYSLREGDKLVFRHNGEEITLTRANPSAVRSTLPPMKIAG